jgi:hypothetical protein
MSTLRASVLQVMAMNVSRRELVWCIVLLVLVLDLMVNCREYEGFWGMVFLWTIPINVIWAFFVIRSIELRWLRISLLVFYFVVIASVLIFPILRFIRLTNVCGWMR